MPLVLDKTVSSASPCNGVLHLPAARQHEAAVSLKQADATGREASDLSRLGGLVAGVAMIDEPGLDAAACLRWDLGGQPSDLAKVVGLCRRDIKRHDVG